VQYAEDYAASGITLTYLGFENEPDQTNPVVAPVNMILSACQSRDFIDNYLAPALRNSTPHLPTQIDCCATAGWGDLMNSMAAAYVQQLATAPIYTGAFTGHGYTGAPNAPLASGASPAWETEWSATGGNHFDPNWYENPGSPNSNVAATGFQWAENIYTALTSANVNAFLYWLGAATPALLAELSGPNESLVQVDQTTGVATPSARLWAFAGYSLFVRPGAVRIAATSSGNRLDVSAFKNTNGSIVVVALNPNSLPLIGRFAISTSAPGGHGIPYLTDATHHAAHQPPFQIHGGRFIATLPAHALVTFLIP